MTLPRSSAPGLCRRGFTLIELMVVVVIIGILSALAVPKFIAITGENQLDGDANALFQDIQWAKLQALKNNDTFFVKLQTVTTSGTSHVVWTIYQVSRDGAGKHTFTQAKPPGVGGVSVAFGLPTALTAPSSTDLGGFLSGMKVLSNGFQDMNGSATGCLQPDQSASTNQSAEKWSDGIAICGGSGVATPDIETGAVYLYSTRSPARAILIMADRSKSLNVKKFRYFGGAWGSI